MNLPQRCSLVSNTLGLSHALLVRHFSAEVVRRRLGTLRRSPQLGARRGEEAVEGVVDARGCHYESELYWGAPPSTPPSTPRGSRGRGRRPMVHGPREFEDTNHNDTNPGDERVGGGGEFVLRRRRLTHDTACDRELKDPSLGLLRFLTSASFPPLLLFVPVAWAHCVQARRHRAPSARASFNPHSTLRAC